MADLIQLIFASAVVGLSLICWRREITAAMSFNYWRRRKITEALSFNYWSRKIAAPLSFNCWRRKIAAVLSFNYCRKKKTQENNPIKCIPVKVKRPKDINVGDYIKVRRKRWFLEYELHALVTEVDGEQVRDRFVKFKLVRFPFPSVFYVMDLEEHMVSYDLDSSELYVLRYPNSTLSSSEKKTRITEAYYLNRCIYRYIFSCRNRTGISGESSEPSIYSCGHFDVNCKIDHKMGLCDEPKRICKFFPETLTDLSMDLHPPFTRETNRNLPLSLEKFIQSCGVCYKHHIRAKYVVSAETSKFIEDSSNFKVGDIITFCSNRTYTNAQNLMIESEDHKYGIIVQINHSDPFVCQTVIYDPDKERFIQKKIRIRPKDTKVITYDKSKITVNSADVVCRRALSRVGETFQELENEFYFSRWCKLADFQPNIEMNFISSYIYIFLMKLIASCRRFLRALFSKPDISAVLTVRSIQRGNDYGVGDVILLEQNQATDIGIVVEILDGGQRCHAVYFNSRDRILVRQDVNVRFGCTEIMEFDESVFFLNPPEEVRKRACQRLGEKDTERSSYNFIEHCKLCKHQPRFILVFFVIILHSIWNIIYFIAETKFFLFNPIFLYFKLGRIAAIIAFVSFLLEKQDNKKSFKWSKLISYVILVWIGMNIIQWLKIN